MYSAILAQVALVMAVVKMARLLPLRKAHFTPSTLLGILTLEGQSVPT